MSRFRPGGPLVPFPPWVAASALIVVLMIGAPGPRSAETTTPLRSQPVRHWVYFKDKGGDALLRLERQRLHTDAWPGLHRPGRPPIDQLDLPVSSIHLESLRMAGVRIHRVSRWLNAASVWLPEGSRAAIAGLPFVREVRPVAQFRDPEPPVAESSMEDARWHGARFEERGMGEAADGAPRPLSPRGEERAHYGPSFDQNHQIQIVEMHRRGYTGHGVTIAILDRGFRLDHPSLTHLEVIAEHDFVSRGETRIIPPSDWEHGTGTLSNVAGFSPGQLIGGAYRARLAVAWVEDSRGEYPGEEDNYIAALEWADSLGADIVTASIGYSRFDGSAGYAGRDFDGDAIPMSRAVDMAVSRGMAVVNSAGNSGPAPGSTASPADADSVIATGAVDWKGRLVSFSSRGPTADGRIKPEVVALGLNAVAADSRNQGFRYYSGTSFSAPIIAGAVALLKEAHPDWDGARLREALMLTATWNGLPGNGKGHGLVRTLLASALEPVTPPAYPTPFALLGPAHHAEYRMSEPIQLTWQRSIHSAGPSSVTYEVRLAPSPEGDDIRLSTGTDTVLVLDTGLLDRSLDWSWTVVARSTTGFEREAFRGAELRRAGDETVTGPAVDRSMAPGIRLVAGHATSSGVTRIEFSVPPSGDRPIGRVTLRIHDILGRHVRTLCDRSLTPEGTRDVLSWDGCSDDGARLPSGVYYAHLSTGYERTTIRIGVVR